MDSSVINSSSLTVIIILAALWTIPWKGVALWRSARNGQKIWFCFLLIINTLAIIDIIYIFLFSKKAATETLMDHYRR
jgi:hypothetical protein